MRILVVAPFFPSNYMPYAGNFIAEQVNALIELGVDVEVVSFVPSVPWPLPLLRSKWRSFSSIPAQYIWGQIPVTAYRFPTLPWNMSLALSSVIMGRVLLRHIGERQPTLIHAHFAYPSGLAAIRCGVRLRIPTVLTVHGSDINVVPNLSTRYRDGVVEALESASLVLAVSNALQDAALLLSKRTRLLVHRIGIDLERFAPIASAAAARALIPQLSDLEGPIVLFVGNILTTKGVHELLNAFLEITDLKAHLVYVGTGPEVARLQQSIDAHRLSGHVHFLGQLPNAFVPIAINAADVLVLPSHREGLGMVCVEALACQKPVIATNIGGIPEVIKHDSTGVLVPPRNHAHLATELRRLLIAPSVGREFGQAGRMLTEHHYDIRKNTRSLIELYQQTGG